MHLTNYAINKRNKNYCQGGEEDDEDAHKRSIISVFKSLEEEEGVDITRIWEGMKEIIIKTILGVQPELSHIYKASQPSDKLGSMCFEILGFDIMLDRNHRPWLLEVNNSPSYNTDTPFDKHIKGELIRNTFKMLNITQTDKKTVKTMERLEYQKRGNRPEEDQLKLDLERESFYKKYFDNRYKQEEKNLGDFERIFDASCPNIGAESHQYPLNNVDRISKYEGKWIMHNFMTLKTSNHLYIYKSH